MRTHRHSLLGAVVVVVAAVSGGCGGGASKSNAAPATTTSSAPSAGASVIKTVTVHETEYKLTPSAISLTKPGTYVFKGVNDGTIAHALAVTGNGVDSSISAINPGSSGTLKVTLPKAGTYEIFCPIDGHKGLGMDGKVTLGGSSPTGGTHMDETTGTTQTTNTSSGY
jgi:uncharacterized cupredoxin-like copper-binding protein